MTKFSVFNTKIQKNNSFEYGQIAKGDIYRGEDWIGTFSECPHGGPVVIDFDSKELEKEFIKEAGGENHKYAFIAEEKYLHTMIENDLEMIALKRHCKKKVLFQEANAADKSDWRTYKLDDTLPKMKAYVKEQNPGKKFIFGNDLVAKYFG